MNQEEVRCLTSLPSLDWWWRSPPSCIKDAIAGQSASFGLGPSLDWETGITGFASCGNEAARPRREAANGRLTRDRGDAFPVTYAAPSAEHAAALGPTVLLSVCRGHRPRRCAWLHALPLRKSQMAGSAPMRTASNRVAAQKTEAGDAPRRTMRPSARIRTDQRRQRQRPSTGPLQRRPSACVWRRNRRPEHSFRPRRRLLPLAWLPAVETTAGS